MIRVAPVKFRQRAKVAIVVSSTEPVAGPRNELAELYAAVTENRPSVVDAHWGMATLEVILAIRQSSAEGREVSLAHQVPFAGLAP